MEDVATIVETIEEAPKRRRGRPKAVPAATFSEDQFAQLLSVLTASKAEAGAGFDLAALQQVLQETSKGTAKAMQAALKPENDTHPGISAFSYPEGDVARPRPVLAFEVWWNGFPIHKAIETHHYLELEILNQLEPGEYQVLRKDGTLNADRLKVAGTRDAKGTITRIDVSLSINRGEKDHIPPMFVLAYQAVHAGRPLKQTFWEGWQQWMSAVMDLDPVPA